MRCSCACLPATTSQSSQSGAVRPSHSAAQRSAAQRSAAQRSDGPVCLAARCLPLWPSRAIRGRQTNGACGSLRRQETLANGGKQCQPNVLSRGVGWSCRAGYHPYVLLWACDLALWVGALSQSGICTYVGPERPARPLAKWDWHVPSLGKAHLAAFAAQLSDHFIWSTSSWRQWRRARGLGLWLQLATCKQLRSASAAAR